MTDSSIKYMGWAYEETRGMDVADLAKIMRKQILKLTKNGTLPAGLKVSVKIDRYSMGQSIGIWVKACDGLLLNPKYDIDKAIRREAVDEGYYRYSVLGLRLMTMLEVIVGQFNIDRSDSMTDYYCVRYSSSADFHYTRESQERDYVQANRLSLKPSEYVRDEDQKTEVEENARRDIYRALEEVGAFLQTKKKK